ncbi:MAG TPA: hypothetical protein VFJ43_02200, partial [Bacteroidia bacterium]|nr:hypothetical protein [Bacteroidia bacterium]
GIRMVFRITRRDRAVGITALIIWVFGITGGIFAGISIGKGFREEASVHDYFPLKNAKADTLYLRVNIDRDMENQDYHSKYNRRYHFEGRWKAISVNGNEMKFGYPGLQIVPSDIDSIQLVVYKYARGFDKREAQDRAKAIVYSIQQADSLITFNSFFTLGEQEHWRAQSVRIELRIPKNKVLFLSPSMSGILDDVDNLSNTLDEDMVDRRWKMTDKGLECVDCAGLDISDNPKKTESVPAKKADTIIIKH